MGKLKEKFIEEMSGEKIFEIEEKFFEEMLGEDFFNNPFEFLNEHCYYLSEDCLNTNIKEYLKKTLYNSDELEKSNNLFHIETELHDYVFDILNCESLDYEEHFELAEKLSDYMLNVLKERI